MSSPVGISLRDRIEGKWQIPTLFVAIALLIGSILRLDSTREPPTFDLRLAQLTARVEDGFYTSAVDYGTRLADRDDLTAADHGRVHQQLARAHYLRAERERRTNAEQAGIVQDEYEVTVRMGMDLPAADLVRLGNTYAWEEEYGAAIEHFQRAVQASSGPALDIRRRIIELAWYETGSAPAELLPLVDSFSADIRDNLSQLHWAAGARMDLLAAAGRHQEALDFLEELEDRFASTSREDAHEYLIDLALHRLGRHDQAEGRLRALRNRLSNWDELYARTGWLLGRIVLSDGGPQRPEEALSFFRDVIATTPGTVYESASRLGAGEALAALERFEESLEQYRQATEHARNQDDVRGMAFFSPEVVRTSATVVAENLRREGHLEVPLWYYEVALSLVDRRDGELVSEYLQILGDLRAGLARSLRAQVADLPTSEEADRERRRQVLHDVRYLFLEAGETFQELARVNALNESRSAEAMWRAADMFDEAGDPRRTITVLEQFARERPQNERLPRVLLRLAQARQAVGLYAEAVEAYQENLRRFPRTPDAGSGLIPLARCYLALGGPENLKLAERTLVDHILDDSPVFNPDAEEFRDALFLLGNLYNSDERFEPSIAVLEEALQRYPHDERAVRAEFLLADGYRRSALGLKEDLHDDAQALDWPRIRKEMTPRLTRAAELFAKLVNDLDAVRTDASDPLQELFLKQARLYQADCLFELGSYSKAVAIYETGAFIYRNEPTALSAYVQIINCRLALGQLEEARAALCRAQYLLKIMPDRVFAGDYVGQSREEWRRFLEWLERAKLLGSRQGRAERAGRQERWI